MSNEEAIFPIRTAAKLLGISIHTLRNYERKGLIIPSKSSKNQRLYSYCDIERILSIRENIKERKINITAIRVIASMIPCYRIINCPEEDRNNCKAYHESNKPCWDYKHKNNVCENIDCRECEVYKNNYDFISIKNTLRELL